jgi:hypothetical protein
VLPREQRVPPKDALRDEQTGLPMVVLRAGTGSAQPTFSDTVKVAWTIWRQSDGQRLGATAEGGFRKLPVEDLWLGLGQGVKAMVIGEKRRMWAHAQLVHGGNVTPPAVDLVMDVTLLDIYPGKVQADAGDLVTLDDAAACPQRVKSTLPGASLRVLSNKCRYTLAEVSKYVSTPFELRLDRPLMAVKPFARPDPLLVPWPSFAQRHYHGCGKPMDASNLMPAVWITGGGGSIFCLCQLDRCKPNTVAPQDVQPGSFKHTFDWIGKSYLGPSDTYREPVGTFAPGSYKISVRVDGSYLPEGASERRAFHLESIFPVTITP